MLQPERAAMVLSLCRGTALSVSQLARKAEGNHQKLIELIRELRARGLLRRVPSRQHRGRPQQLLRTTPLGEHFIEKYNQLFSLRLHSNDNDIKKAIHQADLAQRLAEQGVSVYARFQEVNEIAKNISNTAQASQNPR